MKVWELKQKLAFIDDESDVVVEDIDGQYVALVNKIKTGACDDWEIPSNKHKLIIVCCDDETFNREGSITYTVRIK